MRFYDINEIKDTIDFFFMITRISKTYEQLKDELNNSDGREFSVEIINEEEDLFDVDVGKMTFTVYKDGNNGFRVNNKAIYYTYDTGSSMDCTTIDVEL